jgi:hypothetical protein
MDYAYPGVARDEASHFFFSEAFHIRFEMYL